jgi:hypothetical protein
VNRDTSVCYQISTAYNHYHNNRLIQNLNTVAFTSCLSNTIISHTEIFCTRFELENMGTDFGSDYDLM